MTTVFLVEISVLSSSFVPSSATPHAMRSSSGSPVSPDFSSAPGLTATEQLLFRSYVSKRRTGTVVTAADLREDEDRDAVNCGPGAYEFSVSRLRTMRDGAVDEDLRECLSLKIGVLEQAWGHRGPNGQAYTGAIRDLKKSHQSVAAYYRLPMWRGSSPELQGSCFPEPATPPRLVHRKADPRLTKRTQKRRKTADFELGDSADEVCNHTCLLVAVYTGTCAGWGREGIVNSEAHHGSRADRTIRENRGGCCTKEGNTVSSNLRGHRAPGYKEGTVGRS